MNRDCDSCLRLNDRIIELLEESLKEREAIVDLIAARYEGSHEEWMKAKARAEEL